MDTVQVKFKTIEELSGILQYLDGTNILNLEEIEVGQFAITITEEVYQQAVDSFMADSYTG